ncbi:MAG: hypothetical protein ACI89L_001108 [Phycisphaerales bacterium]|jgi:hypothetical protein
MAGRSESPDAAPRPPRPPGSSRARVVVLHRPGVAVPKELSEALHRNDSEPIGVDHALAAMSHLCGAKAAVLLLCEPDKLSGTRELLSAVERYTPRVTRWEYIPGESPPLRPVASQAPPRARPEPAQPERAVGGSAERAADRMADSFALRLTNDAGAGGAESLRSAGELLTRDEMEALFSEDSP